MKVKFSSADNYVLGPHKSNVLGEPLYTTAVVVKRPYMPTNVYSGWLTLNHTWIKL